ncbi:MAG: TlpA family protein disulfide reductase [Vreelandella alkaliphila]|uniref:TlpA family protein disulfide reductase n=1 Tax=Halomonadaceae TaxID=28256 RepID=UPI000E9EBEA0|nr:redoxin domain-containing protein [Halomonas sp. 3A7M]HBP43003.1 histidinol-phosphatase [Halomonas sp.]
MRIINTRFSVALLLATLVGYAGTVPASETTDQQEADQAYDQGADGEQRARAAGESLIGQPGPELSITTLDGDIIDLSALYGVKPVYIKFWATWCVPCRQQMPGFQAIQEAHGDDIQVIAVNTGYADTEESAREYREEMGLTMPITVDDGTLAEALNLRVTPQHVLIDRSGHITHIGHRDDQALEEALQAVLEPTDPSSAATEGAAVEDIDTNALTVGDEVADLNVTTRDGDTIDLTRAATDKPLGVVFFATWCESYLAESQPETSAACRRVRETVNQLSKDQNVQWVGIISGLWTKESDVESYLETTETAVPVLLDADGEIHRHFGIQQIPTVVLIDADGKVAEKLGPQDTALTEAVERISQ